MKDVFTPKRNSTDVSFRGVQFILAVCCTPRCVAHRLDDLRGMLHITEMISDSWDRICDVLRDHLCGVYHTAEIISALCCKLRRWSLRYVAHRGDNLCGMLHTVEIIYSVCCKPRRWYPRWVAPNNTQEIWRVHRYCSSRRRWKDPGKKKLLEKNGPVLQSYTRWCSCMVKILWQCPLNNKNHEMF